MIYLWKPCTFKIPLKIRKPKRLIWYLKEKISISKLTIKLFTFHNNCWNPGYYILVVNGQLLYWGSCACVEFFFQGGGGLLRPITCNSNFTIICKFNKPELFWVVSGPPPHPIIAHGTPVISMWVKVHYKQYTFTTLDYFNLQYLTKNYVKKTYEILNVKLLKPPRKLITYIFVVDPLTHFATLYGNDFG